MHREFNATKNRDGYNPSNNWGEVEKLQLANVVLSPGHGVSGALRLESDCEWWIFSCTILGTYLRLSECTMYQLSLVSHRELCEPAPELAVTGGSPSKNMLGVAWTKKVINFVET